PQSVLRRCTLLPSVAATLISLRACDRSSHRTPTDRDCRNRGNSQAVWRVRQGHTTYAMRFAFQRIPAAPHPFTADASGGSAIAARRSEGPRQRDRVRTRSTAAPEAQLVGIG